ncbi:MAG: hypothetical protein IJQ81_00885 [Oscillibacter sp.]|nr:hypothetical protein [Oscillibacter sp.]
MKRIRSFASIAALTLFLLTLTSCGQSVFDVTENTGKLMVITAEKARKNDYFMVSSLEVDDGEQIAITSNLTKGVIRVEIIGVSAEQSVDTLPEIDDEATITFDASGTGATSGAGAGEYWMKATCLESATGSVRIEVTPIA